MGMQEATVVAAPEPALIDVLARLPAERRKAWINRLSCEQLEQLKYGWCGVRARPEQLPPVGDWSVWIYLAGRGSGKTRSMAEWFHDRAMSGRYQLGAIVAPTPADARDFCIEGQSGLLHVGLPCDRPVYHPSTRSLQWRTGFRALVYSAEDPDQIRGPNVDTGWATELATWPVKSQSRKDASASKAQQAWDNLEFTLRIGPDPRCVVDTTPRPMDPLRMLLKSPGTVVTRGSTYDNRANLSSKFLERIFRYEGTRLGRQELHGELLEDVEGALWTLDVIERGRCEMPAHFDRVVIGVDPMGGGGSECGIVAAGHVDRERRSYVLADRSCGGKPNEWATSVVDLFDELQADVVVAEVNFGGDMVVSTLRNKRRGLPVKKIYASRAKVIRAEPISTLYDMGEVCHAGVFPELEDQMTNWVPGMLSPDRLDAMVWAVTEAHGVVGWRPLSADPVPPPKGPDDGFIPQGWQPV
ncbi:MAG: terminase large subunit domain-containing protein [Gammaproteobacteria bacterium]